MLVPSRPSAGAMPARPADTFARANIRMYGYYSIRLGEYSNMMAGGGGSMTEQAIAAPGGRVTASPASSAPQALLPTAPDGLQLVARLFRALPDPARLPLLD